jgi:hypothetical protein
MDGAFPEIDTAFSSISEEDNENARAYLFCGQRIDDTVIRCLRAPGHDADHSPQWPT